MNVEMEFSVITLYYRGASFLESLKESLESQVGGHAFEWIIVDDYSNDGISQAAICKIASEAKFPVKSIFLERNYVGSESVRRAAGIAAGRYVIILDQDDRLPMDALSIFSAALERRHGVDNLAGVCGRCVNQNGKFIGTKFPWVESISNEPEVRHVHRVKGEFFQCTRLDLILEYIQGFEVGYTNGWLWNRISRSHRFLYIDSIVRIYNQANPHSISRGMQIRFAGAQYRQIMEYLKDNNEYFTKDRIGFLRIGVQSMRLGIHVGKDLSSMRRVLPSEMRPWITIIWTLAWIRTFVDRLKKRAPEIAS